uniref:Putative VQ-like protein n=1 Tax=Davidia involucrata TaxID=16924 RepID=A0A5B7BL70_DAVIN
MENSPRLQENQNPSLIPSPNSHSTNSTTSSSSNGLHHPSPPTPAAATTPRPITRSEPNNPYPTTFVQADTASFKQVVQMLTGSSETAKHAAAKPDPPKNPIPPIRTGPKKEKASKLYERRNSLKNFKISPLLPGFVHNSGFSPRKQTTPEILSPSLLDFPSLVLSPVTPLIPDPFNRSPPNCVSASLNMDAEDKAIAKKGFYFHPSPANTPKDSEPRLLPLFPVTSPRVSGSSPSY